MISFAWCHSTYVPSPPTLSSIYSGLSLSIHNLPSSSCSPSHRLCQPSKLILRFPNAIHLPISPPLTLPHHTHRTPLNHQTHNLKQRICRRHGRMLGISIVRRCDLDDIGCDEVDAFEAADDGTEFAGTPAASFGGACCGGD